MLLLIDSHVHIHDCYNLDKYFESVFYNFSNAPESKNENWLGFLLLTEIKGNNYFNKLFNDFELNVSNEFKFFKTAENESVLVQDKNGKKIFIVAGKQIIARNGIEVLALCTNNDFENGNDLKITISEIIKSGGIPVLPWGVGKWLGKREKILKNFIESSNEKFFLGDNSGRPVFWTEPEIFKLGKLKGHFVLPGTDSLPISTEQNKIASYGFSINNNVDEKYPANELKGLLLNLKHQPITFGNLESPVKFFKNQILMQVNKRKKK